MTNAELQAKLKTLPDAAAVYTEGGMIEDGDIELDDDGDVSIGPFGEDDDEDEDDDEEDDEE
jgi:hypothetical protein